MRAVHTRYEVPGWGFGELWTDDGVVLAHELSFAADAGAAGAVPARSRANPPKGAHGPPPGTLAGRGAQLGHDSVPEAHVRGERDAAGVDPEVLVARFLAFFAGDDPRLDDVPVDLAWATPFQHAVTTTLRAVARGELVTYGELAALAGYPGAARAVGTFCAHNRFALLVPCHRVVAASGIGGYGSAGVAVKRRLLALEGVPL